MSEGKSTKRAELIAEAREIVRILDEHDKLIYSGKGVTAPTAIRDNERIRVEAREMSARVTTAEAERDAALAVIERAREEATSLFGPAGESFPTDEAGVRARALGAALHAILATAPADALAEHDRVIAEKALGTALEAWRLHGSGDMYAWLSAYRANPEPKEGDRG